MKKVFRNEDNKLVVLNTKYDEQLYNAPENPPNTGTRYITGKDLYVHVTKNDKQEYYYLYCWSMWQGVESRIEVISKEDATQFLISRVGDYWGFPDNADVETLKKYNINIIEEEA